MKQNNIFEYNRHNAEYSAIIDCLYSKSGIVSDSRRMTEATDLLRFQLNQNPVTAAFTGSIAQITAVHMRNRALLYEDNCEIEYIAVNYRGKINCKYLKMQLIRWINGIRYATDYAQIEEILASADKHLAGHFEYLVVSKEPSLAMGVSQFATNSLVNFLQGMIRRVSQSQIQEIKDAIMLLLILDVYNLIRVYWMSVYGPSAWSEIFSKMCEGEILSGLVNELSRYGIHIWSNLDDMGV